MEPLQPPAPDSLSALLMAYRAERAVTARFSLSAPWSLRSLGVEGPLIRLCTGAPYWIAAGGTPAVRIEPGDIVMLPQGGTHTISSAPALPARPIRALIAAHSTGRHGDHPIVFSHGGGGPVTQLYSIHLWMPLLDVGSVMARLPALIVLRAREVPAAPMLAQTMVSLVDETMAQRPGWKLAAARMADLLLAHLLREFLQTQDAMALPGALRGLEDEHLARAMTLMHERSQHPWTVAALAQASHLSRTVFSERFRERVGTTPLRYLAGYRMTLAAQKLRHGQASLGDIAEAVGYDSEKAFARAFQRWAGQTPGAYRRADVAG